MVLIIASLHILGLEFPQKLVGKDREGQSLIFHRSLPSRGPSRDWKLRPRGDTARPLSVAVVEPTHELLLLIQLPSSGKSEGMPGMVASVDLCSVNL